MGDVTINPAGSVSVNPMPVSSVDGLGFVTVKLSVVDPSSVTEEAPKDFVMPGGAATVSVAVLLVVPAPVSLEEIAPVVFDRSPAVVPVTLTDIAQDPLAASVAPDRLKLLAPGVAVMVPPQVLAAPFGVATTKPDGSASLKPTPVRPWPAFGLVSVKPSVVVPFKGIVVAPKVSVMLGGDMTLRLAEAVAPLPPLTDVTALVVFVKLPTRLAFTFKLNVHDALAARLAPVRLMLLVPLIAVMVPAMHDPVRPEGLAITIPGGKLSENPTPVSVSVFEAGLASVKVRLVVPFIAILDDPNDLVMVGGASTLMPADAVPPVPPSFDVTAPVVLFCAPAAVPVTLTLKVHEELAASVPPARAMLAPLALAVIVPEPQVPVTPGVADTVSPAGNVSLTATPLKATVAFGLVMVKLSVVLPFSGMETPPNVIVMVGGLPTVMLADAVVPVPPSLDMIAPVTLFCTPATVPVTFTTNEQAVPDARPAPDRLMLLPPAAAVMVPAPHEPVSPLGDATRSPEGNVSVKPTPLIAPVFGLLIVKLKVVLPLSGIVGAPKVSVIVGADTTLKFMLTAFPIPASLEDTGPATLVKLPAAVPVTLTLNVQALLAASTTPDRLAPFAPAPARMIPLPQFPVKPLLGADISRPAGSTSANVTPVSGTGFGLLTTKLSVVLPFNGMLEAPKAAFIV